MTSSLVLCELTMLLLVPLVKQPWMGIIIPAKWGQLSGKTPDLWSKGLRFKSQEEQQENFLLWGQLSVLTLIQYLFHPRVPTVVMLVGKRPQSFCPKCRWQVTAKRTWTLCMWLCMKWHCKLMHGCTVSTERVPRRQQFHTAPAMW